MEDITLHTSDADKTRKVREILALLHLDEDTAKRIESTFERELECGMSGGLASSCLQVRDADKRSDDKTETPVAYRWRTHTFLSY